MIYWVDIEEIYDIFPNMIVKYCGKENDSIRETLKSKKHGRICQL